MGKRAKLVLIPAIALTIGWLAWSHIAHKRLQAKIDELTAHHEPVHFSDLDFAPVPNNQNAAFYYQAAIATVSTTAICPSASNFTFPDYPPYPASWQTMVDQAVAANPQALALARSARKFDRADWGVHPPPTPPFPFSIPMHYFNGARNLAELLGDAALQAHSHGNDAEALQRIFDLLHLADAVGQPGFLIGRLVDIGIQALAVARIETIATDLQIDPNRAEVIKLIHQLLDEQKSRDACQEMVRYERVRALNESIALASHATILRPMIYLGTARIVDDNVQFQLAVAQQNWPAVKAMLIQGALSTLTSNRKSDPSAPRFSRFADLSFGLRSDERYVEIEFRVVSQFRMAAISLAANLYHADHNRWPPDLKSLVPKYLPAIPDDPFYPTPHPLGYIVLNGSRPLLFCETNGVPSASSPPSLPVFGWNNNTGARQWLDITNWWQSPTRK
jgi:hypothetical protein